MRKSLLTIWLVFGLTLACVPVAFASDFQVGPTDQISIVVYGEEDLTRLVTVSADGTVKLPLVGRISVKDMTVKQIEAELTKLYGADYLVNPQIEVRIAQHRSQSVQLLGAVRRPSVYPLKGPARVLDVLGAAGGVGESASRYLLIIRESNLDIASELPEPKDNEAMGRLVRSGSVQPIRVDLQRLMKGDLGQNLSLKNGDLLFVPRGQEVYLLGEVKRPGSLSHTEGLTLLQAVTKAGGFTKVAQEKKVQVIRIEKGEEVQRTFNLKRIAAGKDKDFTLKPEDLIVVPESIL